LLFGRYAADFSDGGVVTLAASAVPADIALAGAGAAMLSAGTARDVVHDGLPDAAFAMQLPVSARDYAPAAHYVRPPDAILPL
jgi:hypothetical protein